MTKSSGRQQRTAFLGGGIVRWAIIGSCTLAFVLGWWVLASPDEPAAPLRSGPSQPLPPERRAPASPTAELRSTGHASGMAAPPVTSPHSHRPRQLPSGVPNTLAEQRRQLFERLAAESGFDAPSLARVRAIFEGSLVLGQGNPVHTRHPMTRQQCQEIRSRSQLLHADPRCGARHMVTVFDPGANETPASARLCIDQFEFPNLPCEYPVVHVRAREAALLCEAVGKRLCDAHEWEGACAGALRPVAEEYAWGRPRPAMTWLHNEARDVVWAYGPKKDHSKCATGSSKRPACRGGYSSCASNSYPTGAFPGCVSRFGVYDQHGNVAEHMNLPLNSGQLTSSGNYGATEMKGSWFVFASHEAHPDDCRWRAKDWHPSAVMAETSHSNYHLGFRCCKSLESP